MRNSMGQQALITEAIKSATKDFAVKPIQQQKVLAKYVC
jgi:hypothetical protein